jgi:cell division protein FtsB
MKSSSSMKFVPFAIAFGVFALFALRAPNGLPTLLERRDQIRELQEQNATLAAEVERKRIRIGKLADSRAEQDLQIREKLKLLRPGEKQFILPDEPKTGN